MTPSRRPAVGLSVGATTLAAVSAGRSRTARPAVTRAGEVIDGFVERVGDPVGILAADGFFHSAATLLAEALRDVARGVTAGGPLPETVAVAHPGHWTPAQVEALRRALRRIPPWSARTATVTLLPDYAAAVAALCADLPARGVAVVCDVGGSATTITLVDLRTSRPLGKPLRHSAFSGQAIDRMLMTQVLAGAGMAPGGTGTSAIAALTRLRADCRAAKERLSALTVTEIAGPRGPVRLTRPELEDVIRRSLDGMTSAVQELLCTNGIAPSQLAAVVSVGGGAAIPAVTAALSCSLRVPVVTAPDPAAAAAVGAAVLAAPTVRADRGDGARTIRVPADPRPVIPPLAWSQAADPEFVPLRAVRTQKPRPTLDFVREPVALRSTSTRRRYRPLAVAAAALAVIAGAGVGTALAVRDHAAAPVPPARTVVVAPPEVLPAPPGSG